MKTLNDFKQEVAEKYGIGLSKTESEMLDQAAERYAEYRVTQMEEAEESVYIRGWNEALQWALDNSERDEFGEYILSEEIVKALK